MLEAPERRRVPAAWRDPAFVAIAAVFCVARVAANAGFATTRFNDSPGWLELSFGFDAVRPWPVPLLYTIVPTDAGRAAANVVVALVGWLALATVAHGAYERVWLRRLVPAVLLVLGLCPPVTSWDGAIASESLALSVTVALFAAWWAYLAAPGTRRLVVAGGLTAVFVLVREVHVVAGVFVVGVLLASLAWRTDRRGRAVVAGIVAVVCVYGALRTDDDSYVRRYNLASNYAARVFPEPGRVEWFANRGMPVESRLVENRREALDWYEQMEADGAFRRWLDGPAERVYLEYLATHPAFVFGEPAGDAGELLAARGEFLGRPYRDSRRVVPAPLDAAVFGGPVVLALQALLGAAATAGLVARRRLRAADALPLVIVGLAWPLAVVVWHGSPIELARHALPFSLALRIALLVLVAAGLDRLLPAVEPATRDE